MPQHVLLHDGHAWTHPTHGEAFRQLKVDSQIQPQVPVLDDNASWSGRVLPKLLYTRRLRFTLACMRQAEAGDALDQRWALCLLLILERARGSASAWAPYIRILPTRYGASVIQCSTALWH